MEVFVKLSKKATGEFTWKSRQIFTQPAYISGQHVACLRNM